MTEEMEEIIYNLKQNIEQNILIEVRGNIFKPLLDYITNLQQERDCLQRNYDDNEQAIQKLIKEFKELQQENETLKQNQSGFTLEDYTRLLNNYQKLQEEHKNCTRKHWQQKCAEHHVQEKIYKLRCEKAMELLKLPIVYETHQENGERDELLKRIRQAENILNGSDE